METKLSPRPNVLSEQNTSNKASIPNKASIANKASILKKTFFPRSKLTSYNGIILAACLAILFWVLLRWDYKHIFHKPEEHKTVMDKARDIGNNVKSKYQYGADIANATIQETISKMKDTGSSVHESIKDASEHVIEKTKEKISNLKDKKKEPEDLKGKSQQILENIKDTFTTTQTGVEHRFEMEGLIEQAYLSLQEFLSPHLAVEEQIPVKILSGAKAVVFFTMLKGGIGISGAVGTGFVVARDSKGKWGGPCAILLAGLDIGLNIGIEKSDHIIILRDETAIRAFESVGQLKLGLDVSVAAGPKGRDAEISLSVGDKGYATTFSYSMAKGAYLGLSLEGQIITIRNDCNEQFYGKPVKASEILEGSVKSPKSKELKKIFKILNAHTGEKEEI